MHMHTVYICTFVYTYTYIYMYIYMYMPTGGFPYGCVPFLQIAFFLGLALAHMLDAMLRNEWGGMSTFLALAHMLDAMQ